MSSADDPKDYREVPVGAARELAERYNKDAVVIVSQDEAHSLLHVTTYGVNPFYKQLAAHLGERFTQAAGAGPDRKTFQDFRHQTQAEWTAKEEALVECIATLRVALEAILAMEDAPPRLVAFVQHEVAEADRRLRPALDPSLFRQAADRLKARLSGPDAGVKLPGRPAFVYRGVRRSDGSVVVEVRTANQADEYFHTLPLEPSLAVRNHSPDGFEWGYSGSGPAQLALALILHATGDADLARRHHQNFKFRVVAGFGRNPKGPRPNPAVEWTLDSAAVWQAVEVMEQDPRGREGA